MIGVKCWIYRDLYSPKQRGGEVGDGEAPQEGRSDQSAAGDAERAGGPRRRPPRGPGGRPPQVVAATHLPRLEA